MRRVQVFKFANRDSHEDIQMRINDWAEKSQSKIVDLAISMATDPLHQILVIITYEQE